ncbi:MAG: ATP-binding protein [Bacteroidota bacterium]
MRWLFLPAVLFCTAHLPGQNLPEKILFDQIPITGTIQSSLTEDIIQDPYGMIWVAKNTLYRYNGRDFTTYNLILPDSNTFGRRDITRLMWDSLGNRLLVGTRYQGLLQYRYKTNTLEKIPSANESPIINNIVQTANGAIWVNSFAGGIYQLRNDTLVRGREELAKLGATALIAVNNSLWAGCLNEIVLFDEHTIRKRISLSPFYEYLSNATRAHSMHIDSEGHLWIGTERDGVIVLDTINYQLIKRFSPKQKPFYSSVLRIAEDDQNLIWMLTESNGLIVYSRSQDRFHHLFHQKQDVGTLANDHCTSICIDNAGIVWIGSVGPLNKYDREKIKFQHLKYEAGNPLSLSDDNIRGIFEDTDSLIYVAASDGYLNIVNLKESKTDKLKVTFPGIYSFVAPLSIHPWVSNRLLIGTSAGLLEFDKRTKHFSPFLPLLEQTKGQPIRQIVEYGDYLYFTSRGRVLRYNKNTHQATFFGKEQTIANASHLTVDKKGRLWMGVNTGIVYSDEAQTNFYAIDLRKEKFRSDGSNLLTLSITEMENQLWFSIFNHGIYIIDHTQPKPLLVGRLTTDTGLPDNTIYAMLPDARQTIWMPHNNGLSQYFPKENRFVHYSVGEGLQDEEFNRLAYCQGPSGKILLGGINGLNVFNPVNIAPPKINLDIRLLGLKVLSFPVADPSYYSLIEHPQHLELAYAKNSLQFEFFVPDFHEPTRYLVEYKLEPFDQNWIATNDLSSSAYANLPPGNYTFRARASGPTREAKVIETTFTILPPYWQSWWFMGLCVLVFAAGLYGFILWRTKSIEIARLRLETLLKIRTREIERSREELENLNKKKDLIFSILSHDLRSPLTTLKGFLGLLIDNNETLSKEDLRKYASSIRNSVTNSLDLIDNTLFWSLSQTGNISYQPTTVALGPILEKIKGLYQLTADKKKIQLHVMNVEGLSVNGDENMVYVLLRNLVSNAIKFTPEGKNVSIDAMQQGAFVAVRVKDEGIGMSPVEVERIFESDHLVLKRGTSSEKGTGLGLVLCKKFVELNNGKLLVKSNEGAGSEFTVLLPKA